MASATVAGYTGLMKIGRNNVEPAFAIVVGIYAAIGASVVAGYFLSPPFASFVRRTFYKIF